MTLHSEQARLAHTDIATTAPACRQSLFARHTRTMQAPAKWHFTAAKRLFAYAKVTLWQGKSDTFADVQ